MLNRLSYVVLSTAILSFSMPLMAQPSNTKPISAAAPEAIIYRDTGFQGPAVNVSKSNSNLGLSWSVNSIRIKSGAWQVCSGKNFTGKCLTIDQDRSDLKGYYYGWTGTLASMRPITTTIPAPKPSDESAYECDRGTQLNVRFARDSASIRVNNSRWITLGAIATDADFAYANSNYKLKGQDKQATWIAKNKLPERCNLVPIKR